MISLNKKKVLDVDLDLLKKMSSNLAQKIESQGYIPDHIIYIERAGAIPGFEMALFFNCSISSIRAKRSGTSFKSKIKFILRFLPRFVTHFLRRLEIGSSIHDANKTRAVSCSEPLPNKDKKILLVDDAVDTGHSIGAVLNYLTHKGLKKENIKIAVLTTTGPDPVVSADFMHLDQVICAFPWSYDSREHNHTLKMIQTVKQLTFGLPEFLFERQRIVSETKIKSI